jgi:hypothetical protein
MRRFAFAIVILIGGFAISNQAHAVVCANGVYRAACAGPHGAVVARKHYYHGYHRPYYRGLHCAAGVYRAGCAGPRGAAVVRRPYLKL